MKIFVVKSYETADASAHDLQTLFSTEAIFSQKADAQEYPLSCPPNLTGLRPAEATFVIPGGGTISLCFELESATTLTNYLQRGSNFVGVCAGAYVATNAMRLHQAMYSTAMQSQHTFPEHYQEADNYPTLKICPEYQAYGSFFPNTHYRERDPADYDKKVWQPYVVNLTGENSQLPQSFSQLFIGGCGFVATQRKAPQFEVVARYHAPASTFFAKAPGSASENMPAMLRRKATSQQGGVFLSATHIEACVDNSEFFKALKQGCKTAATLHESQQYTPEDSKTEIVQTLRATFTRN